MYNKLDKVAINYLIKIRTPYGHYHKNLNLNMNPYIHTVSDNIDVLNLNLLIKSYKYLFHNFSEMFLKRNSFFIVGTNPLLPMTSLLNHWVNKYPMSIEKNGRFTSYYISGFIDKKWIEGLFTNWKIFYKFIGLINNYVDGQKKRFKYEKYFTYLKGIVNLKKQPIPDFVIMLDDNYEALHELHHFQIPLIGIVDSNMDPKHFLYKFYGNNDSKEHLEFFFEFLSETIKDGRLREQEMFLSFLLKKLNKNCYD